MDLCEVRCAEGQQAVFVFSDTNSAHVKVYKADSLEVVVVAEEGAWLRADMAKRQQI